MEGGAKSRSSQTRVSAKRGTWAEAERAAKKKSTGHHQGRSNESFFPLVAIGSGRQCKRLGVSESSRDAPNIPPSWASAATPAGAGYRSRITTLFLGSTELPSSRITRLKITLAARLVLSNGLADVTTK